jgi:hypothetical protein
MIASTDTRLRVVSPAPRDAWAAVYASDPEALVSQSPEWVRAIEASGGWRDASRLYETRDGLRVVLPLVECRPLRIGPRLRASMPHAWGMGGVIADGELTPAVMRAIVADVRGGGLQTRIRPNPLQEHLWAKAAEAVTTRARHAHLLDLQGGREALWASFHKSTRRGVAKAEKSGLTIEVDGSGRLLPVFEHLHRLSVERWAAAQNEPRALARWRAGRVDPPSRLAAMAQHLGQACRVWAAWQDKRPVAAAIILLGRNASATRAAMDKELAAPTRANDLLEWSAISEAIEAGCRRYHFGESAPGSGVAAYKERFGAVGYDYREYRFERLPITRLDAIARAGVKKAIGFRDA